MKKLLVLLLVILTCFAFLASCDKLGFGDKDQGDKPSNESGNAEVIWSSDRKATLVFKEETNDISSLYQHIYQQTGIAPATAPMHSAEVKNEVVIGESGRQISKEAYHKLDRYADLYDLVARGESAYLIYAEGGSLAVAYSDTFSRLAAIDYLVDNITGESFAADGVVMKSTFKIEEFLIARRDEIRDPEFDKIAEDLGQGSADALRLIYGLYDTELYYLLANLYDPEIGGFYYSVSARDNKGYLPDIESTVQALNLIDNSGLSHGAEGVELKGYGQTVYWPNYLSDATREQLYAFAMSLKSEDGYFYHPQWGTSISSSRKGRDQGWGNRLIAALTDMVDGVVQTASEAELGAARLINSASFMGFTPNRVADSIVAPTVLGASSFELSLASEADFIAWLDSGLSKDSYSVGNTINSNISAIKKAGLFDCLRTYLVEHQFENGLWEEQVSYNAINGLMKLCGVFGSECPFPNPMNAINSTIQVMLDKKLEVETICFVYNPWVAIKNVLPFCSEADKAEFKEYLEQNAEMLILDTFSKLGVFKKDDGGFSMNPNSSSQFSQMALVALPGQPESDVNATGIAISTVVSYMIPVLGIKAPTVYSDYDAIYFRETLDSLQGVIKKTGDTRVEVIDFDLYDPSEGEEANGVVLYPDPNVQVNIGNDTLDEDGYYKWLSTSVVPNPAPGADSEDLVLRAIDYVYDTNNNGKFEEGQTPPEMAGTGSSVEFMIANSTAAGECYVFDADLYFNSASANNINDCLAQINFTTAKSNNNSAIMNVYAYNKDGKTYLRLQENWAGPDKVTDGEVVTGIPVNEWFNLRCEVYKSYSGEGTLSIMAKFYLNGEYAGECDGCGYWFTSNQTYADRVISSVKFALYRHSTSEWYFNNVSAYKENEVYKQEEYPSYIKPSDTEIYDFEKDFISSNKYIDIENYTKGDYTDSLSGTIEFNGNPPYNKGSFMSIAQDPKDASNRVLKVQTNSLSNPEVNTGITLTPFVKNNGGNIYVLDYDYYLECDSDITAAPIMDYSVIYGGKTATTTTVAINKLAILTETLKFRPGNVTDSAFNINAGSWIRIRTVLDGSLKTLTTYVSLDNGATWQSYMVSDFVLKSNRISEIKLSFGTTEAENRVQYLDNLSFTLIDELYMTLTDGTEKTYGVPMKATPSDTKVYDFTDGAMESNKNNVNIFNALGSKDSAIEVGGKPTGLPGSFLSIANDPENAANRVLKIVSNENDDGSAATGSFMTFNPYVEDENGKIFVFDFDFYYECEGDSAWGGIDSFEVNYSDFTKVSEQAVYKPTLYDKDNDGELDVFFRGGNISGDAGTALNTEGGKWVKIRAVVDDENDLLYIYQSTDGGNTWDSCRATPKALNDAVIVSMTLVFNASIAINRVQYVDNISFVQVRGIEFEVAGKTVSFGK